MNYRQRVLIALCEHLEYDYRASLGHGEDEKVIRHAAEDFEWLLAALDATVDGLVNLFPAVVISLLPDQSEQPHSDKG